MYGGRDAATGAAGAAAAPAVEWQLDVNPRRLGLVTLMCLPTSPAGGSTLRRED